MQAGKNGPVKQTAMSRRIPIHLDRLEKIAAPTDPYANGYISADRKQKVTLSPMLT
jgi:hypothetical protein